MTGPEGGEAPQTYLGDGAYMEYHSGEFILFTFDGISRSNEIVLDYSMLQLALSFANRATEREVK